MEQVKSFLRRYYFEILLVLPMSLYILGFTIVPIFQSILMEVTDEYTGAISLNNYVYLFGSPNFVTSIFNTIVTALLSLVFQLVLGLGIATVLKIKRQLPCMAAASNCREIRSEHCCKA